MHQVLTKTLLLLAIVLAVVSLATPDWVQMTSNNGNKMNVGLFQTCLKDGSGHDKCSTLTTDSDKSKDIEATRGLMIAAAVMLVLSLGCEFIPVKDFTMCPLVSAALLVLGLGLMVAALSVYGVKVYKPMHDTLGGNMTYGYSYWLGVASLVLAVLAGVSGVLTQSHGKQLRKGLRPPKLVRQTARSNK